ncbi:MAG: hypothetical protein NT154_17140 [Verrucomicrobia bacterium]|nr:hypothetical protein [Verrucomicrobiota bacterium]
MDVGPGGSWGDSAPANTVWFTGANDATINYAGTNGYFPNITIDKSGGAGVRLLSDLLQLGGVGLTVAQGTYNLNGHLDRLTAGAIVTSNAVLTVGAGGRLDLASGKTLAVQPGGRLEVIGAAGNPATISRQSGNYTVLIQSNATIAASQAVFEYLDTDGVYVMDGGIVDLGASFNDCTFRNGVAGGSLLRVENNQTFIAMRTAFPINAGGGAANVRKSSDQGRITFRDATGIFAGENFDNDPYNRLDWDFGLLSTATLDIPSYVTLGGRYEAKASVGPTNASEPIYYVWTATDGSPTQHVGGITGDRLKFSWKTPGIKTVQLVASNQWGLVTATQSVIVQALRIADIQPQPGTNTIRLVIEGTTPASHYEIECTPDMDNVPWTRVMPHGSGWTGSMSNTVWMDYSTSQRPLESFTNLFYRARVLLPAEPLPSTSATK